MSPPGDTTSSNHPLARAGLLAEFVDAVVVAHDLLQRAETDSPNVAAARAELARAVALARGAPQKEPTRLKPYDDVAAGDDCQGAVASYATADGTDTLRLCSVHAAVRNLHPKRAALRRLDPRTQAMLGRVSLSATRAELPPGHLGP